MRSNIGAHRWMVRPWRDRTADDAEPADAVFGLIGAVGAISGWG